MRGGEREKNLDTRVGMRERNAMPRVGKNADLAGRQKLMQRRDLLESSDHEVDQRVFKLAADDGKLIHCPHSRAKFALVANWSHLCRPLHCSA